MATVQSPDGAHHAEPVPELTATQYVILAESQRKKRALAEGRLKYNALVDENKRLLLDRCESEHQTYEVTEYMRREILTKNEKIARLEKELDQQKTSSDARSKALKARARNSETEAQVKFDELQLMSNMKLREAAEKLDAVMEFKSLKEEMERELLGMREECDGLNAKLEEAARDADRRFLEGTTKLKKEFEQKLEEMKKRYEEDMDDRLDASVKRILQQNRRIAQELQLHMEESETLQRENKLMEADRKRLLQELQIKLQMEQGYVQRNAKQARTIKDSNEKLLSLEATLQSLVADFEREREFMRSEWNKVSADMQREVSGYKRLIELKTKDLKNVRRLAQEVLLQRSDVEVFFVSTLQYIRNQIELENKSQSQMRPLSKERAVDISQLSWSDRETVLRLAFAKINNQAQQAKYTSLPNHSFQNQVVPSDSNPDAPTLDLQGLTSDAGPTQLV